MATVNLSVNVGESKTITFHSGGTYNTEDIVFDVSGKSGSTTIAAGASGDTNQLTLSASTKYKLTSAGSTFVFTTPPDHTYNFSGVSFTSTNSTASDKNANNLIGNGTYYYSTNGPATSLGAAADGGLYVQSYNSSWVGQIAQDYRNGRLFVRGKNNGTWSDWKRVANYDEIATSGHTHSTSIATSDENSRITLAFGTKYVIKAGGTSYVFAMPANPNTNTTYTIATGDSNGQIKVTPSSGNAYNVSVKGLGSAAYTESSAYATSGHTHTGFAASNHTHATSIATSTSTNQITLAFGGKYAITAGGTSYVFAMPANPNTNTTYTIATGDGKGQIKVTPSSGDAYNVSVKGLGSAAYTESSAYATSGHTHSGVYKPVQTEVSDPTASSTATAFIDTISQNANGVIAATKKTLPTASTTVAGITKVGASGGAATYDHTHTTSIATSTGTNQITLEFGGKYAITAGGTSYVFTMPANPDTDVKVKQTAHTITDATEYPIITTTSASPTSGTAYEAKYATHAAVTGSGDIVLKKSSNKCKLQFDNSLNCLNFIFE